MLVNLPAKPWPYRRRFAFVPQLVTWEDGRRAILWLGTYWEDLRTRTKALDKCSLENLTRRRQRGVRPALLRTGETYGKN